MKAEQELSGLKSVLSRMADDYGAFRNLALRQRKSLIENDMETLREVLIEMETLADGIFRKDEHRIAHLAALSKESGKEVLDVRSLATLWPDLDFNPIFEIVDRLKAFRNEIEKLVEVNRSLIQSSRKSIQLFMEALVQDPDLRSRRQGKTYDASGIMTSKTGVVRNLVNRRG